MDPALAVDVVSAAAVSLLYDELVTFDHDGRLVPGLASAWEVSADGRTLRFVIDPRARASDGSPVTAREVVASFQRLLDPHTASPRAWVLSNILGAEAFSRGEASSVRGLRATGQREVTITLEAPYASFLKLLAMPNAAVLPAGGRADGSISTGPWVVEEHVRDSHLLLRPNPFWRGKSPSFREVYVRILPEEFTRVAEFEVGNLDVLEVPASAARRFREDPRFSSRVHRQVALVTEYVGLNNEDPILADPRVRRALNHAVNVELILERVLEGRGVRSVGSVPPALPGGGADQPYAYDPSLARKLLEEAGVSEDWTLELWQRPNPLASQVLEAIQADLKRVGIACKIRLRDWSALKSSIDEGRTQAFFINWYADYPDPENFLVPLFHSSNIGGGGNRARFRGAEIDSLLEVLQCELEPARREALAAEIDRRVHRLAPWIYLWHPVLEVAVSERVEGFRPHPIPSCERWLDVRPAAVDRSGTP